MNPRPDTASTTEEEASSQQLLQLSVLFGQHSDKSVLNIDFPHETDTVALDAVKASLPADMQSSLEITARPANAASNSSTAAVPPGVTIDYPASLIEAEQTIADFLNPKRKSTTAKRHLVLATTTDLANSTEFQQLNSTSEYMTISVIGLNPEMLAAKLSAATVKYILAAIAEIEFSANAAYANYISYVAKNQEKENASTSLVNIEPTKELEKEQATLRLNAKEYSRTVDNSTHELRQAHGKLIAELDDKNRETWWQQKDTEDAAWVLLSKSVYDYLIALLHASKQLNRYRFDDCKFIISMIMQDKKITSRNDNLEKLRGLPCDPDANKQTLITKQQIDACLAKFSQQLNKFLYETTAGRRILCKKVNYDLNTAKINYNNFLARCRHTKKLPCRNAITAIWNPETEAAFKNTKKQIVDLTALTALINAFVELGRKAILDAKDDEFRAYLLEIFIKSTDLVQATINSFPRFPGEKNNVFTIKHVNALTAALTSALKIASEEGKYDAALKTEMKENAATAHSLFKNLIRVNKKADNKKYAADFTKAANNTKSAFEQLDKYIVTTYQTPIKKPRAKAKTVIEVVAVVTGALALIPIAIYLSGAALIVAAIVAAAFILTPLAYEAAQAVFTSKKPVLIAKFPVTETAKLSMTTKPLDLTSSATPPAIPVTFSAPPRMYAPTLHATSEVLAMRTDKTSPASKPRAVTAPK